MNYCFFVFVWRFSQQAGAIIRGIMQQSGTNVILEPVPPRPATERMVQIRVSPTFLSLVVRVLFASPRKHLRSSISIKRDIIRRVQPSSPQGPTEKVKAAFSEILVIVLREAA